MSITPIQWAPGADDGREGHTINPLRARQKETGAVGHFCVHASTGCLHCYADRLQKRFRMPAFRTTNRALVELFLDESKLEDVERRRKPTGYFWCDMTDMFLDDYPDEWLVRCFETMERTPHHIHMVLTKRPERMKAFVQMYLEDGNDASLASNIRLGVSVENQGALWRIDVLKDIPAACRFVSFEPLLEDLGALILDGIHWAIVGGESGPGARPTNIQWPRNIQRQCERQKVMFFMKQVGARIVMPIGSTDEFLAAHPECGGWLLVEAAHPPQQPRAIWKTADSHGGDISEWPLDLRVRQFPSVEVAR